MKNVRKFLRNPTAVVGLVILVTLILIAVIGPFFVQDPFAQLPSNNLQGPSMTHLLGTDDFGRDILARIVVGARYSLTSGIFAVALGLVGGLLMGTLSGYYGGLLDHIIMTICDILLAFPSVLLAMSIVMVMQPSVYTPMVAVGLSSIPTFARLVRAQFMSLKTNSYIEAVRSSGAGDMRIIFRHLLLNSMGPSSCRPRCVWAPPSCWPPRWASWVWAPSPPRRSGAPCSALPETTSGWPPIWPLSPAWPSA